MTEELVALDTAFELEARLLSELETLEELRNDELTMDELMRDELLSAILEELAIITTTELLELDNKLLLEFLEELIEENSEDTVVELFTEELLLFKELLTVLDEARDDVDELLLTTAPLLLEESDVVSLPPQPANINTELNRTTWILSNLRKDRLTTQIVIKRFSSNNGYNTESLLIYTGALYRVT